jgi:hypothetical protein
LLYRLYFRAHSIKSLKRNVLSLVGIKPVRQTLIGMVEHVQPDKVSDWALKMQGMGRAGI